jgi:hypothetical protein
MTIAQSITFAEALEAADEVEGEAVGGAGGTTDPHPREPASRSAAIPSQTASLS